MEAIFLLYVTILLGLVFNLSLGLKWPHVQRVVWLKGLKFLILSHHFAKCSDHVTCGSSDAAAKIVSMTLQGQWIKDQWMR